jgi:hypothetical protein
MSNREILLYFSWSRPGEINAPLTEIDDRFPAVFELRRLFYPAMEALADPSIVDQGIGGFLDHVQKANFVAFAEQAGAETGHPVRQVERVADNGDLTPLDEALIGDADTIIVISFDASRTGQAAAPAEVAAVRRFLDKPDNLIFVCPHHVIGDTGDTSPDERQAYQLAAYLHHGDKAIPPHQDFGGFARSLLAGLGATVDNRFGLHPARTADGSPAPITVDRAIDTAGVLDGVEALNLHAHLPHFERIGDGLEAFDVLATQRIDPDAPPHPFTEGGRDSFDAILQSRPGAFAGKVLVSDTTLWSSTAGGVDNLRRLWSNVASRAPL